MLKTLKINYAEGFGNFKPNLYPTNNSLSELALIPDH